MRKPVSIVLVGAGGYGNVYLSSLLDHPENQSFTIAGVVDPRMDRCFHRGKLDALKVPRFETLKDFYSVTRADLAVISTPIHFHCEHTCLALSNNSHVLCEKPLAVTLEEADRMIEARERSGKAVAVGYQWSFSKPILELKSEISSGALGKPVMLKSLCCWPRDESYYNRNSWAGKKRNSRGDLILDSPVNNAMAHYLHNMLYVLGKATDRSAEPGIIQAELYRANNIESFDTAAMRIVTKCGAKILFYVSHAVRQDYGPVFSYEFTKARVIYDGAESPIEIHFKKGEIKKLSYPDVESQTRKLWHMINYSTNGGEIPCGVETARPHTVCVKAANESKPEPDAFPGEIIDINGEEGRRLRYVNNLEDEFRRCYAEELLPSELNISWANSGEKIAIA